MTHNEFQTPRSGRKHKAWGVSPRSIRIPIDQPARAGGSLNIGGWVHRDAHDFLLPVPRAPFQLHRFLGLTPPGFMLSPAPQVRFLPHEFVTSAVYGKNETRLFRIRFQLLPEVNYVRVDRARVRIIFISPNC